MTLSHKDGTVEQSLQALSSGGVVLVSTACLASVPGVWVKLDMEVAADLPATSHDAVGVVAGFCGGLWMV